MCYAEDSFRSPMTTFRVFVLVFAQPLTVMAIQSLRMLENGPRLVMSHGNTKARLLYPDSTPWLFGTPEETIRRLVNSLVNLILDLSDADKDCLRSLTAVEQEILD